jgi:hypothetical protein
LLIGGKIVKPPLQEGEVCGADDAKSIISFSIPFCLLSHAMSLNHRSTRSGRVILVLIGCALLSGCFRVGGPGNGVVPPARPPSLDAYYSRTGLTYSSVKEDIAKITDDFTMRHLVVTTDAGPMTIDFYQGKKPSDDLVFVFPVLGGKLIFEQHVAEYLAEHGVDCSARTLSVIGWRSISLRENSQNEILERLGSAVVA